jgi:AbrB family looped-hinge helix DNA binding protein
VKTQDEPSALVKVNKQGRVVIPASLRRAAGIKPGDELVARIEGHRIVLETPGAIIARIQAAFDQIPQDVSLVDELLTERRESARQEAGA